MRSVGIDYSMTSPALCIFDNGSYAFHYLSDKPKYIGTFDTHNASYSITGHSHKHYDSSEERFSQISDWALGLLHQSDIVNIEDYSMGSKGKVFHIAENTGILKYKLFLNKISFQLTPPTVVKKLATGKGNANKDKMYESFIEDTGLNLLSILGCTSVGNPVSDIADSYHLCSMI